ncbi:unnamed protein product [Brassica napus]|uniref:(rape) hypothetical protein n=1 Tax=Brassica napus TaxID=3708 RepID=A0A816R1U2_BRANA|nr:unnamed protein product [Brassica napus]
MVKPAFAEAVTCVWWDINRCPVPSNADVRFIGPCIKTKLEKEGYCGPLTINAVGILTEVSHDLLRQVNSSGISLHHVPTVSYTDIDGLARDLLKWTWSNPSPANLVLITNEPIFYETENTISRMGYNVNRYFFSRCLWSSVRGAVLSWKQWMVREQDSGVFEVEKWREEGESDLHCSTCSLDIQSFESFMTHLNSKEHALEVRIDWTLIFVSSVHFVIGLITPICSFCVVKQELEYYPRGVAAARRHGTEENVTAIQTTLKRFRERRDGEQRCTYIQKILLMENGYTNCG